MLEIPESHTIAQQLQATVVGRRIDDVIANHTPHGFAFYTPEPTDYPARIGGKTILAATAHGGLVELSLDDDMRLLFGDGVNLRLLTASQRTPAKHQLLLSLSGGDKLVCTIQMYGGIWAFLAGANDNKYYLVAKEKPSPLRDDFDEEYFNRIVAAAKPTLSVKALLATEQRIPGLGNGTLQDILFQTGCQPRRKLNSLSDTELTALYRNLKSTLKAMTEAGGRDTEKDLFGDEGGYVTILSKKTWRQPCPRCGDTITRQQYLGGNVYFCPTCQT